MSEALLAVLVDNLEEPSRGSRSEGLLRERLRRRRALSKVVITDPEGSTITLGEDLSNNSSES